jgi:AraC-like DNA-binding protein
MCPAQYGQQAPRRELVRRIARLAWSVDLAPPYGPIRVLPDAGTDLLVTLPLAGGAAQAQVFGVKARALVVDDGAPVARVALHLQPGAAARVLGIDASELRDRVVPLEALWGDGRVRELVLRVQGARDAADAVRALEDAVLRELAHWRRAEAAAELADAALSLLLRAGGLISVAELCRTLRVGERRLERAFLRHVGLPPKAVARTLRFQRAEKRLRAGGAAAQVALACGYADQAHLSREFRQLAGVAPSAYARSAAAP